VALAGKDDHCLIPPLIIDRREMAEATAQIRRAMPRHAAAALAPLPQVVRIWEHAFVMHWNAGKP
jgi:hypothetical protein